MDKWDRDDIESHDPVQYGFTGRQYDSESGKYYHARMYSPELGRFMSQEPIGFGGGDLNLYWYVGGNPVRFGDTEGKNPAVFASATVDILINIANAPSILPHNGMVDVKNGINAIKKGTSCSQ